MFPSRKSRLLSLFLMGVLILGVFQSGCLGGGNGETVVPDETSAAGEEEWAETSGSRILVLVTPQEVEPGESVLITVQAPESTEVRVSIENENSGYTKTIYVGPTNTDGSLTLEVPISSKNLEKKIGRNIIIVEAPSLGLWGSTTFAISGTPSPPVLAEVPIKRGNWNPGQDRMAELQKGLVELAYLFSEAEMVTNSVVYVDNERIPYEEFKKRVDAAIYLWEAVQKKASEVGVLAEELASESEMPTSTMAPYTGSDSSEVHALTFDAYPITGIRAQEAGGTIDIVAHARDKRIAEIVENFAPKIGESAARRRAALMWFNEYIQDEAAYQAKFYDVAYKVLLTLETAGKFAEGAISLYSGYTGLLSAKTTGEAAFKLGTLILTKFGVVFSLTEQGVKIYTGGTLSDESYAIFTPGHYLNEAIGIIGVTTGELSDPDNVVYIAGKVGNLVSPLVSEGIEWIIQMDLDPESHKLILHYSELLTTSPWSSGSSFEDMAPNIFLPGFYVTPTGERFKVEWTYPIFVENLKKHLSSEYVVITPEGKIKEEKTSSTVFDPSKKYRAGYVFTIELMDGGVYDVIFNTRDYGDGVSAGGTYNVKYTHDILWAIQYAELTVTFDENYRITSLRSWYRLVDKDEGVREETTLSCSDLSLEPIPGKDHVVYTGEGDELSSCILTTTKSELQMRRPLRLHIEFEELEGG
ncbi:hypothetical protein [Palaeococcus ferrophilus]|uniref:hypothetical protein n=1 Tax=Palaeococcus ferrophilus TaxID=83868 RepID=UPI00064EE8D6|nr:hypothetical protein [Palaeococcus ferrophilus]